MNEPASAACSCDFRPLPGHPCLPCVNARSFDGAPVCATSTPGAFLGAHGKCEHFAAPNPDPAALEE